MRLNPSWTLEELAAWAGTQSFFPLWNRVCLSPHPDLWPRNKDLEDCLSLIAGSLPEEELFLLHALCLSSLALTTAPDPDIVAALQAWTSPQVIGLPLSWPELMESIWQRIPVLVANEHSGRASLIWTLVGQRSPRPSSIMPGWAETCLDAKARAAVHTAAALESPSSGAGFFFWPIIKFHQPGIHIRGSSLGLPVLLGFHTLTTHTPAPSLAATGGLHSSGGLLPPAHMEAKARAAEAANIRGLIVPITESTPSLPSIKNGPKVLSVPDLSTARSLWRLYAPGQGRALIQALQTEQSPYQLLSSLLCLSQPAVSHVEHEYGVINSAIRSLFTSQDMPGLSQILDLLCPHIDAPQVNQALIQAVLDSIYIQDMDDVYVQSPELCLRICRLQLMRCRHQGRVTAWEAWKEWMDTHNLEEEIACSDQGEVKLIMFQAERMVQDQHNRFVFDPAILHSLGPEVQETLAGEEKRFHHRLQLGRPAVHRALGCLYGTLAQHFGFCGPDYLEQCRKYVHQAQLAFGQGQRADSRPDWLREFSYLVYAYLDAGESGKAHEALQAYLECSELEHFEPETENPFQHAAFVRFLADSGRSLPSEYIHYWTCRWDQIPNAHPWQLWAVNFGRLMPDKDQQKVCWETAVSICKAIPGETTKAMLLVPLSLLDYHGLAPKTWLEKETREAMDTIYSSLHNEHFAVILEMRTWRDILFQTRHHLPALFPFAYR